MLFGYFHVMQFKAGRSWTVALALTLALMPAVAACGGSDAEPTAPTDAAAVTATVTAPTATSPPATSPPTTAPSSTPPTTVAAEPTAEEVEAEIIAAYIQGWDDYYAVLEDTSLDPQFARQTHMPEAYEILVADQAELKAEDVVVRWPSDSKRNHGPEILQLEDQFAIIRDCFVNDAYGIDSAGEVADDELATSIWSAEMRIEDGGWKIYSTTKLARELGVWDCE